MGIRAERILEYLEKTKSEENRKIQITELDQWRELLMKKGEKIAMWRRGKDMGICVGDMRQVRGRIERMAGKHGGDIKRGEGKGRQTVENLEKKKMERAEGQRKGQSNGMKVKSKKDVSVNKLDQCRSASLEVSKGTHRCPRADLKAKT